MAVEKEDDTTDVGVEEQAERLTQQVRDKVKAAKEEEADEPADNEPDDDDEPDTEEVEGEPTRKEKRANRWREVQERAERAERAAEAAIAAQQQLMQQFIASQQSREPQVDPRQQLDDTYEKTELELIDLRRTYSMREHQYAQAGQQMPQEELLGFVRKQRDLEVRKQAAMSDYYVTQNGYRQDPRQQQIQTELAVLRAQHADVFANRAATFHVDYAYKRMTMAEGKPESIATAQEAIAEARKVILKQGSSARPTQAAKSKYTGGSSGAGGGAAVREGTPVLKINDSGKRMADMAYPHITDDNKRYETWMKAVYKKDRERKAQGKT
jgi:hypothetical protein